jgi:hypothetical protein
MFQTIAFNVNNGRRLELVQRDTDCDIHIRKYYGNTKEYGNTISAGDMVMLLNLYRYIKDNDIQNDFINPDGKNRE